MMNPFRRLSYRWALIAALALALAQVQLLSLLGGFNPASASSNPGSITISRSYALPNQSLSPGTVWAWGRNDKGQLGDGTATTRPAPVQVGGRSGVTAVAAGAYHSLALRS